MFMEHVPNEAPSGQKTVEPPTHFDEVDAETRVRWRFYRTDIERAEQLTNGKAWIQTFEHVLKSVPRPRRVLGVSLSDSGDPRYSLPAFAPKMRNDASKAMRDPALTPGLPEGARHGVGKQLRLPSGEEVLLICNIGPRAPAQLPKKFREMELEELTIYAVSARCPHMGACLNEGEIKDVEDLAAPGVQAARKAIIRCPWHNYQFDIQTGEGVGNDKSLLRYPVLVRHGAVYVGTTMGQQGGAAVPPDVCMDIDMEDGPPVCSAPTSCHEAAAAAPWLMPAPPVPLRERSRSPRLLRLQHTIT